MGQANDLRYVPKVVFTMPSTNMAVGYCSAEQSYAKDKPCSACGSDLTGTGKKSRFWEGGKGCRDTSMLSRNDPRKYKNPQRKSTNANKAKK